MIQKRPMTEAEALRKTADLCARSEHCSGEMADKMRKWGLDEETQARVIARLVKERYIDDERYTRSFVNDKVKYNKWGRRKIEQALWMKHVDSDTANRVLDEVADEEYLAVLRPLLKSKYPTIQATSDYERSMKLIKYAMWRGFSLHLIRQCIDEAADVEED